MNSVKRLSLAVFAASTMLLATQSAGAGTLIAPDYGDDVVSTYSVANGTGSIVAGSPFSFIGPPNASGLLAIAGTPDGTRAAATFFFPSQGGYQGLTIAPGGEIAAAQNTAAGAEGTSIAISPTTSRAYVATRSLGFGLRIYDFTAAGAMEEIAGSPAAPLEEFYEVVITPDGRHLFAVSAAGISRFAVNPDGSVVPLGAGPAGIYRLQVSPDGRFLFGGSAFSAEMHSFAIAPDGSLSPVGTVGLAALSDEAFTVSPDGRFLFVPNSNADVVEVLAVASSGSLSVVGASQSIDNPQTAVTSVDGRFLHVGADQITPALGLKVASIDANGVLGPWTPLFPWYMSTAARISFRAAQAPTAAVAAGKPVAPGKPAQFDASKTTIALGSLGRFEWDFGDGTVVADGGATPTHQFPKAGVYDVKVRAHDSDGCSTQKIHTGQSMLCNGGPQAEATVKFDTLPVLSSLKVSPKNFKRKSKKARFRYRLNEKATVTLRVYKPTKGRKFGKSCRKQTSKNRKRKKCTRWVRVGPTLTHRGKIGANSLKFRGKVKRRVLKRGKYRVTAFAVDPAKGKSALKTARFRVR